MEFVLNNYDQNEDRCLLSEEDLKTQILNHLILSCDQESIDTTDIRVFISSDSYFQSVDDDDEARESRIDEVLTEAVSVDPNFSYLATLENYADTSVDLADIDDFCKLLLDDAEYNNALTPELQVACSIAMSSAEYWHENLTSWENLKCENSRTTFLRRPVSPKAKAIIEADIDGVIYGGLAGGAGGSLVTPIGGVIGALGGGTMGGCYNSAYKGLKIALGF